MRRIAIPAALAICSAFLWAAPSPAANPTSRACTPNKLPGVQLKGTTRIVIYCGSARATVVSKGHKYHFTDGMCLRYGKNLLVGVGKLTTIGKTQYNAFLLQVSSVKNGTSKTGGIRYQLPGKDYLSSSTKITLRGKATRGTFSGHLIGGKTTFSGSFVCK